MPATPLPPFSSFEASHFHIGGNPSLVGEVSRRWLHFAEAAEAGSAALASINDGGFIGSEGNRYRELVNGDFPKHLAITGEAHGGVGGAIGAYLTVLSESLASMGTLRTKALVDYANVDAAVIAVNAAETKAAASKVTAAQATTAAVVGAPTPAAPALAAGAATANTAAVVDEEAAAAARAHHAAMVLIWEEDLAAATAIRADLSAGVNSAVAKVQSETRKKFEDNPNWLKGALEDIGDWIDDKADLLSNLSDVLQMIGGLMLFVPGLQLIGAAMIGVGVAMKGILAATGNASWTEFGMDLVLSLPGGALLRAAKAGKLGAAGMKAATGIERVGGATVSAVKSGAERAAFHSASAMGKAGGKGQDLGKAFYSKTTRGGQICFDAEPVDMATGAMVDFETDLSVPGTLPLVVDRNANSAHELGRALGPTWVSRMDVRIEVCSHEVLMVSSDGALLTFPPAPLDGSEVRADGRPWYLSFVDGAYRVRDVAGGVTWVFSVVGQDASVRMESGQLAPEGSGDDLTDDLDREIAALLSGADVDSSVAGASGSGVEIGVSSLVHRTGHWIDYHYDAESATMVSMVRSDGTEVTVEWNREVNRVVGLWVSNPSTHPDEAPVKVIGYEYDMAGQLVRVLNSSGDPLTYHYDSEHRPCGWTDRNGASYFYVFDDAGRVVTQVGTGGMFANALVYLPDEGTDAPAGGSVCVLVETAGEFAGDPHDLGDAVVADRLRRIEELPLVAALRSGGLVEAGLVGQGRDGERGVGAPAVPEAWLSDEVLGDVRARVFRSTPSGDVWRIVEPSGTCVDYAHDAEHRIVSTTGPGGSQTTVEFDDDGAVISTTFPDGSAEVIEPGQWGTPARIVGRDGRVTEAEVDELGQITSLTDPTGATTTLEYQWAGSGSVLAAVTDPGGLTTRIECDAAGRELARTDAAGLRSSVTRDVLGRPVETMDPAGVTEQLSWTPESWLAGITHADGTGIANVYDGEGNLVACTNEIGATTTTEFTVFDKPVAATDASGAVTRLVYNTQMELAAVVNADGHRWDFTRDLDGVVVAERDYNGLVTRFAHDPAERWSTQIAPDGTEQVTVRDVLGRPVRTDSIDGTVSWDWDEATGRLLGVSSPEATITYRHDGLGRRVGEMVRLATGEQTSVDYRVDHTGMPTAKTLTLPDGTVVDEVYSRDEFDRVSAMTVTAGTSGAEDAHELAHVGFGVDAAGRRDRVSVGSLVRQYRYDSRGRRDGDRVLTLGSQSSRGSSVVAGREYTWRADSVVTGISDLLAGPVGLDVDALGRVTGVTRRQSTDPTTGGYLDPWTPTSTATAPEGQTAGAKAIEEFYSFTTAGVLDRVDPGADFRDTEPAGSGGGSSRTGSGAAARGKPENLARLADLTAGEHTAEAGAGSASAAVVGVDLDGTLVTRVGRTRLHYDACGRVVRTVTKRLSRKPLVRKFVYGATGQVRGFSSSDEPEYRWVYVYDGLARRVAKEKVHTSSGEVVYRVVFLHDGDRIVGEQTTVNSPNHQPGRTADHRDSRVNDGLVWVTDPATGELLGQVTLATRNDGATSPVTTTGPALGRWSSPAGVAAAPQHAVDAVFHAMVTDLASAPRELINPDTGVVAGWVEQSLYGRRTWRGEVSCPLLFAGQYEDVESGWVYNRFRYYDPTAGVYGAQDPLGVAPRLAGAQGYVDNAAVFVDELGLMAHTTGNWTKNTVNGKTVYQNNNGNVFDPHMELNKRGGGTETNLDLMKRGNAPIGTDHKPVNLHHIGQRDDSALVEVTKTTHDTNRRQLHIFDGLNRSEFPSDVTPVNRDQFTAWRSEYWMTRAKDFE